jgi:hypothetical protein
MRIPQMSLIGLIAAVTVMAQSEAPPPPEHNARNSKPVIIETMPQTAAAQISAPVRREATTKRSATDGSLSTFQVWWGLTIAAGQTLNLPSDQDWTGVNTIAVAVDCTGSAKNAQIFVWWGMNIANYLTATDAILGSNFTFANMGGAMVPAYGSILRLQFKNTGTTDLSCDQVTAYGVNR